MGDDLDDITRNIKPSVDFNWQCSICEKGSPYRVVTMNCCGAKYHKKCIDDVLESA